MTRIKPRFTFTALLLILIACVQWVDAKPGEVTHVVSHDKTMVVTDPSKGFNAYRSWAVFPPAAVEYRRVVLSVTYRCPDSLRCGEWDYIDAINLRRVGGIASASKDIELARMISPYGSRFGPAWHFTWRADISDFAFLLHDSVEVEFNHGGYESNTDRGWRITLDFALTEGRPPMQCVGLDTLWNGSFPYGDSSKPIESLLHPISFTNRYGAQVARLRIMQTGHGMDDSENCAEFCSKDRRILLDDSLRDQRQIWRKCGTNPLYPQAGTWLYDRANWCPGAMVYPDVYDFPVRSGETHVLDIDMQPYISPKKPSASYFIHSYLFYCTAPWAANDVSLEDIAAPGTADDQARINPVCGDARIVIKNNGRDDLKSVVIRYGIAGAEGRSYNWQGELASQRTQVITLPGAIPVHSGDQAFEIALDSPNGVTDEFPADNALTSEVTAPPVYPAGFILVFLTNNDSLHNGYELRDEAGTIVRERRPDSLHPNTVYRDTFNLPAGCYQFVLSDTAGDGLDFWANPEGGYGYVRLLDMNGHLMRSFISDFGSEIQHSFRVAPGASAPVPPDTLPLLAPFPVRSKGIFSVDVFLNETSDVQIAITDEGGKNTVFRKVFPGVKEGMLPIDISSALDGIYFLRATAGERTATRRIKIKHAD